MAEERPRNGRVLGVLGWVMVEELLIMVEEWPMDSRRAWGESGSTGAGGAGGARARARVASLITLDYV